MKKLLAIAFASVLGISILGNGVTVINASGDNVDTSKSNVAASLSLEQIDKFDKYVKLNKNTNQFYLSSDASTKLSTKEIMALTEQLKKTNSLTINIRESENSFITKDSNSITVTNKTDLENRDVLSRSKYHEGKTGVKLYWWGVRAWLSKSTLVSLGSGITIGGIWIPEPLVSKILATAGVVVALAPGGIAFNYTPVILNFWGFEWQ